MIFDKTVKDFHTGIGKVLWQKTEYADVHYYYAEDGLYIIRILVKIAPYYVFVYAKSPQEAVRFVRG